MGEFQSFVWRKERAGKGSRLGDSDKNSAKGHDYGREMALQVRKSILERFKEIKRKDIRAGCTISINSTKKRWVVKAISKNGMIYTLGSRVGISPHNCELA